jgi:arsenate reductase
MSEAVTIYHNPRCSKSRQTLALLEQRGITPVIVHYLDEPPDPAALKVLLSRLGLGPRELIRTREARYRELGLDAATLSDDELLQAMSANPILIERPIVVTGKGAVLGRPPENVLDIL